MRHRWPQLFGMKKLLLLFLLLSPLKTSCQIVLRDSLYVFRIDEKIDCYIISTLSNYNDTIRIVSQKTNLLRKRGYEKLCLNKKYFFDIKKIDVNKMSPIPPGHFAIKTKKTILWINNDKYRIEDIPYFGNNLKGLYVKI
jgi:hypothetical protein